MVSTLDGSRLPITNGLIAMGEFFMNLLFKRAQTDSAGKVKFKLWAQTELDENEQHIVKRYRFDGPHVRVIDVLQPNQLRNAVFDALAAGVVVTYLLSQFVLGIPIGVSAGIAAGYFFYDRKRESVLMRDLIHGRHFSCDSIVDLAHKEAWLTDVVATLRQVMESAKHWDGTETIPIPVLSKEAAKQITARLA